MCRRTATMTDQNGHPDCIVIAPVGTTLDEALRDELQQRRRTFCVLDDPFQGFALLCLAERLQSSRSAWGLERAAAPVLIIATTLGESTLTDLLGARDRYLKSIAIYRWRDGRLHPLRDAESPDQPAPDGQTSADPALRPARDAPVLQAAPPPERPHGLRLTEPMQPSERMADQPQRPAPPLKEHGDEGDDDEADDSDRPASLSAEEVQMLLGTEEGPSQR